MSKGVATFTRKKNFLHFHQESESCQKRWQPSRGKKNLAFSPGKWKLCNHALNELYKKIYLRALSSIFMLIKYQKLSFFPFLTNFFNHFYFNQTDPKQRTPARDQHFGSPLFFTKKKKKKNKGDCRFKFKFYCVAYKLHFPPFRLLELLLWPFQ